MGNFNVCTVLKNTHGIGKENAEENEEMNSEIKAFFCRPRVKVKIPGFCTYFQIFFEHIKN